MMSPILKMEPNRVRRNYTGGFTLDYLRGKENPKDGNRPEEWLCSCVKANNPGQEEIMNEGLSWIIKENKEILLSDIITQNYQYYLGTETLSQISFLVKWLDSSIRLHTQAHPTREFAKKYLNSDHGKFEAYYVLAIRPEISNPYIRLGFQKKDISKEIWTEIVKKQDYNEMDSCFEKIPVHVGDIIYIPGGLPHAIGEGIFLLEMMEPSDLVVRCEFERCGIIVPEPARFMGKDLEFCMNIFDYTCYTQQEINEKFFLAPMQIHKDNHYITEQIISKEISGCFEAYRIKVRNTALIPLDNRYSTIVCTKGKGLIKSGETSYSISTLDSFFIAAACKEITLMSNLDDELEICMILPC